MTIFLRQLKLQEFVKNYLVWINDRTYFQFGCPEYGDKISGKKS